MLNPDQRYTFKMVMTATCQTNFEFGVQLGRYVKAMIVIQISGINESIIIDLQRITKNWVPCELAET